MDGIGREGWQANGQVFGASGKWSGVADPFSLMGDDGLAGGDIDLAGFMLHTEGAAQDDGVFVKFWSLTRLFPSLGAAHLGYADGGGIGVDTADEFFNDLRLVSGGLDARGAGNE